ncbi:MAG: hypothetical protein K940chlam7_01763 [Chlamydiae bacterium]|nr:hypothetical protein [Chlamydiota bacterium]
MEELVPITPVNFFQMSVPCYYLNTKAAFPRLNGRNMRKYLLPDTSALCHEEHFADVTMAWNEEGIECRVQVEKKFEQAFYPDVVRGDSVEVFIDTRDVKTSGYNTRFCHHFFFLPEAIEGHQAGEITHFRTEDTHELCDPSDIAVKTKIQKNEYVLQFFIPKGCLFGYDPEQFDRLGFSYRINRPYWESQHFSVVTEDYKLEEQPSLWSSMRLVK